MRRQKQLRPHERIAAAAAAGGGFRGVAEGLPVHFAHLHKIAQGKCEPNLELALALEQKLAIPVEDWPSLRPAVEELLQRRRSA